MHRGDAKKIERVPRKRGQKFLLLLAAALFALPLLTLFVTQTASAAGEIYSWSGSSTIKISGGDLSKSYDLTVFEDGASNTLKASGRVELDQSGDEVCRIDLLLAVAEDQKTAKIERALVSRTTGGSSTYCNDENDNTRAAWTGSSITLSGSPGKETTRQQEVDVILFNTKPKNESPRSVTFSVEGPGGTSSWKSNIGNDGNYYGTFPGITPGKWEFCVDSVAKGCKTITKYANQRGKVTFGDVTTPGSDAILVNVVMNTRISDPNSDETFGPYEIELQDGSGKVLTSSDASAQWNACPANSDNSVCGKGTVELRDTVKFVNVQPGNYKVCFGATCVDADKKQSQLLTVELKFSQNEIDEYGSGSGEDQTTCAIDGIGWIVCPIANFLAELNDSAFGFLQGMLAIQPAVVTDDATIKAWSTFRDLANVAFIVAFLVIVYSQVTGVGVSNYGIKKLLPRIFIAAILVNMSYIICALAVDLSNIIGSSIYSFLGDLPVGTDGATGGEFASGWQSNTAEILALTAGGIVLLVVLLPALGAVILALALILFILIARQAFVLILLVIAPLAFVAFLLPNTETWFKKWRQAFFTVLMVYPIIGAIFGASTLAATILMGIAGDDNQMLAIVALATLALPLFAVPLALKGAMSAAGTLGTRLSNLADRSTGRMNKQLGTKWGQRAQGAKDFVGAAAVGGKFGKFGQWAGGRSARREQLYDTLGRKRKAADETYLNRGGTKLAARERSALGAESTADLTKRRNKAQAGIEHLRDNGALHSNTQKAELALHDDEAKHKSEATKSYLSNSYDRTRREQAVQAGIDAKLVEKTVEDKAEAEHLADPNNAGAYNDRAEAKGRVKNEELARDARFEGSRVGQDQAFDRKGIEGTLNIARGEQEAVIQELTSGTDEGIQAAVETTGMSTDRAAQLSSQLSENDTQTRVVKQRTAAAQKETDIGYAKQIGNPEDGVTDLAVAAGGIRGNAGISQAQAVAKQTMLTALKEGVAAEKVTMTETPHNRYTDNDGNEHPGLIDIVQDEAQPFERRAAAAGTIAAGGYHGGRLDLIDYLTEAPRTDDAERSRLADIEQIAFGDMKKHPTLMGSRRLEAMDKGRLHLEESERIKDGPPDANGKQHYIPVRQQLMLERLQEGKISEQSVASMDPDEVTVIKQLHDNGLLTGEARANFNKVIDLLRENPQAYQPAKLAQRQIFDTIHPPAEGNSTT